MGLLDDAIREHLELKRKHGANPEDVARQEQEALGPGQRNEFAQPEAAASRRSRPNPPEAGAKPRAAADGRGPSPSTSCPRASPASPRSRRAPMAPGYDEDPWLDDDPDEVPAEESLQPPRRDPARPAGEEEDVLEETPDFLQETPEHDRLWFEQKPPRDFDWDK